VVLLGPKGTGKDHLAIALAKLVAMETGLAPVWINGLDLFSDMRTLELSLPEDLGKDIIDPYRADILIISDLAPPAGVLSDFCQNSLFKLIDYRYSNRLPTWVTMNVSGGEEAAQRIGHQTVDRLRHGAIVVPCNWPSYRQPLQLGFG
jgi:DNA replication protein DnaC